MISDHLSLVIGAILLAVVLKPYFSCCIRLHHDYKREKEWSKLNQKD